jgi:hypothetical protein
MDMMYVRVYSGECSYVYEYLRLYRVSLKNQSQIKLKLCFQRKQIKLQLVVDSSLSTRRIRKRSPAPEVRMYLLRSSDAVSYVYQTLFLGGPSRSPASKRKKGRKKRRHLSTRP